MTRHPLPRAFAQQVLAADLARIPEALIVPLGQAATEAVALTGVEPRRVLVGFPHPSGGNGHRQRLDDQGRQRLSKAVVDWFS